MNSPPPLVSDLYLIYKPAASAKLPRVEFVCLGTCIAAYDRQAGQSYGTGRIYDQSYRITPDIPMRPQQLPDYTIHQGIRYYGRMGWTLGDDGDLQLLKARRGETSFKIRPSSFGDFILQEPDGQNIATLRPHSVDRNIKDVEITSSQRSIEDIQKLVFFAAILLRSVQI
jgi:hypothetical protein